MRVREFIAAGIAAAAIAGAGLIGRPVHAADPGYSSFVTPFPANGHYRLYLLGDSLGAGLAQPLAADLAPQGVEVVNKAAPGLGLARGDGTEWDRVVDTIPATDSFQIAVIQFGTDDRASMRVTNHRVDFGTPGWKQEYERRADALMKSLKSRNVAVYWIGLPIMRFPGAVAAAQLTNGVALERVRLGGGKYIDTWSGFADADGAYSDQGPDLTGIVKQLRLPDGVHMTPAGYQKLANFVEREITKDVAQAQRERDVPLAGDEAEQQNVRDETLLPKSVGDAASGKAAKPGRSTKDYPADDGSVVVRAENGTPTTVAIVRPIIPGAVVAQIVSSRTAQQPEPGHSMSADLMGGFTVMSSIATSADANRGGLQALPLTENPFYRLLIRGDSLPPKPGRVDDFTWPRPGAAPPPASTSTQ